MTLMTERAITAPSDWATLFRRRAIELRLTQRDVDELANLAPGYFSTICAGTKIPGGAVIVRICAALKIELRPVENSER
jgi:hypothetical protein